MNARTIILSIITLLCAVNSAFANNITYVLAARESELFKTQSRVADMTANVNTTGFKAESDIYAELKSTLDDGSKISFSKTDTTTRNISQGPMEATGRPLDIAINGPGYFMVETPRGRRYTRSGNLQLSSDGSLITKDGYYITDPGGGRIQLAEQDINISIRKNGLVFAGNEERGQIGLFIFKNEQLLRREGQALYRTSQTPIPATESVSVIAQGVLESSNVNSVRAMTDLIEVSRSIETTKKMQADFHDLQLNSIRQLARQ